MNQAQYKAAELARFDGMKNTYFDTVADFAEWLDNTSNLVEQIEWMENGSYGAGVCFALQRAEASLNSRTNDTARIGQVVLKAMYGAPFKHWHKLPQDTQDRLNQTVNDWLESEHSYAA